jgi:hypothetical protein
MTLTECGWPDGTPLAYAGWAALGTLALPDTFGPAPSTERVYVIVSSGRVSQQPMTGPAIVVRGGCMRGADGSLSVSPVPDDWQPPKP